VIEHRPVCCVLDVNETLSDLTGLVPRLVEVGLAPTDLEPWFNGVLRDGFALSLLGGRPVFSDLAADGLRVRLGTGPDVDASVTYVLGGFAELDLHPDVAPGLRAVHALGIRLLPLTNGATAMSDRLLGGADLLDLMAHRLSVEDVGPWKPHPAPYRHALATAGTSADQALMVAVHPWDIAGAGAAGLRTAWVDRPGDGGWPSSYRPPDLRVRGIDDLAEQLEALPAA